MNYADLIKKRIIQNVKNDNSITANSYSEHDSAIIFKDLKDNFLLASFKAIDENPNWKNRTNKIHSHFKDGTLEMQSSNSSDALLMNIFCHPKFTSWKGPSKLLNIDPSQKFEFGWNPYFENENPSHPTEIDLKIGNRIFESKLTESSFTTKEFATVESYKDFNTVFHADVLKSNESEYNHYQLIRNILAAYKYDLDFSILIDEARLDLLRELFIIVKAIKDYSFSKRISFFTWQEISASCGKDLQQYLNSKYF